MKATIISGVAVAVMTVTAVAAPATTSAISMGAGMTDSNYRASSTKFSIGPNGISFEDTTVRCSEMSLGAGINMGGLMGGSSSKGKTSSCNPAQVVNNPPANSTVTISGLCDADAAKAKTNITGTNVNVVIQSTGPCVENDVTPVTIEVVKYVKEVKEVAAPVTTAKATTAPASSAPVELPQTGTDMMTPVIATALSIAAYGGTLAVRAFRARA